MVRGFGWATKASRHAQARDVAPTLTKVTAGHIGWADLIVVMEKRHKERLRQKFPDALEDKRCVCLFIPDDYEFMDPALIEMLRDKMMEL